MRQTLTLIIYKALDYLKQESPFWWAVVQSLLWGSFTLISTNWVNFKGEDVVLIFLGGLISSVGSRTSKKLSEAQKPVSVNPDDFKQGFKDAQDKIEEKKQELSGFKIEKAYLPKGNYIEEITKKNQIIIHHTSGGSVPSTLNWWIHDKQRIGTHFIIDRDGRVINCIPLEYWAYHLGVSMTGNKIPREYKRKDKELNKSSISIELASWGGLTKKSDKYYSWSNQEVKNVDILDNKFRGYDYFEKYTEEQLRSLKKLIEQLSQDYQIPISPLTFDINYNALNGVSGTYTHVNYRTDKSDCYPNKDLIQMFNVRN